MTTETACLSSIWITDEITEAYYRNHGRSNDYKKLQSDSEYSPKIIDEEVYARFKDNIKENYIYHEWDTCYGEEYYLYELMPKINEILKENDLTLDDVRLLCKIG